jgi:serine/threonine protein phosphatase 1
MKRLIAIGDIHGHLDKLNRLLVQVQATTEDQLVFLGDYIDRGPDSRGVIERLLKLQEEFPLTVFLRGNHEQLFIDSLISAEIINGNRLRDLSLTFNEDVQSSDLQLFLANGGMETLSSYSIQNVAEGIPENHVAFLKATKFWWRNGQFIFVHAGLKTGVPLEDQDLYDLLWLRRHVPDHEYEIQVVGHTPTKGSPYFGLGVYNLDTGAGYSGPLTACDVLTKQVWQAF